MAELTPDACRAARALARWSVRDLADHAGVAFSTVHRLEKGEGVAEATRNKLKAAFDVVGVEITNGGGTGARKRFTA